MTLKEITQPVSEQLREFEAFFKNSMKSKVSLLDLIVRYMTKRTGKQVRPAIVFLTAELCGGYNQRSLIGAAMVEFLHTATLVHDDIVDEAKERRGLPSINAAWTNKIAVLVGDYMLAKGLLSAINENEFEFLRALSATVKRMSEGELLQIQKAKEIDITEETYFRIISDKTASLIATCCEIGAISATGDENIRKIMKEFGESIGIAFQIKDDIFDITGQSSKIGKPVGNDLKEKKLTLPLLYAVSQAPKSEGKSIVKLVKSKKINKQDISKVIEFVNKYGGIAYAETKANQYSQQAIQLISEFPNSTAKTSLINLAKYVISRET